MLQFVLFILEIQMFSDSWVLPRKLSNLVPIQVIDQPRVNLPWELIEELVEEFDVDEQRAHIGQLVRNDIEEDFWTKRIVFWTEFAFLRLECC